MKKRDRTSFRRNPDWDRLWLVVTFLLVSIFPGCGNLTDLDKRGNDENTPVEIGTGIKPDWVPDNSAVTVIELKNVMLPNFTSITEQKSLIHYNTDFDVALNRKKLTDNTITDYMWSHGPGDKRLVLVKKYAEKDYRLIIYDDRSDIRLEIFRTQEFIEWSSWSYDNSKIAFLTPHGTSGISIINYDGTGGPYTINNDLGWDGLNFARCTADGPNLLYVAAYNSIRNIYKIALSGGRPEKLTDYSNPLTEIFSAELSPDGGMLAYTSQSTQNPKYSQPVVFLKILPDGGTPRAIVSNLKDPHTGQFHNWHHLAWSPDGNKIAALSRDSGPRSDWLTNRYYNNIYVISVSELI